MKRFDLDEVPPESCTLTAEGKGTPGFVNGTEKVWLFEEGESQTLMTYAGEVQIGGRLAGVGQRMIDTVSKSMIRQGLDVLDAAIRARVTARAGSKAVAYTPPTQTEFAAAVVKDMAGGLLASRIVLWIAVAVIALVLLGVIWVSLR